MNKLLTIGVASLAVAGVVGAVGANAYAVNGQADGTGEKYAVQRGHGQGSGYQTALESKAKVLSMSVEDLQNALETKTMSQIAVEKGMTEESFQAKMAEAAKARWEARGLSSQEIAQRIADREQRHRENRADHEFGSGEGQHQGSYGHNR